MIKANFINASKAVEMIKDESTICTIGMTLVSASETILKEIEKKFLEKGHPKNITLVHSCGQSDRERGIQHLAHEGLVKRIIGSHWGLQPRWMEMIAESKVEAFCLPQGQIAQLYRSMACGLPGKMSKVGLGTFIDPRYEGGKMNERTKPLKNIVDILQYDNEEYMFYKAIPLDIVIIRGTTCDEMGNMNGRIGKSACGSMGYAIVDAQYADYVIAITDNLVPFPNLPASIDQTLVDTVVVVDSIGDPKKIVSGAIRDSDNPRDLLIAKNAVDVIVNSGYFKDGFVYQTGTGGASLSVTKLLKEEMIKQNIKASLGLGGITSQLVSLLEEGLMDALFDTQSFDLDAVRSIAENPKHYEISASFYANPNTPGPAVNNLTFVMLSALEIDKDFNVNVMTKSDGTINQAVGGHQDTAAGSKISVILAPLMRARIPIIVDKVTTVCTPGEAVDVICTDYGIVVNPRRKDLIENLTKAGVELKTIEEMKEMERFVGKLK